MDNLEKANVDMGKGVEQLDIMADRVRGQGKCLLVCFLISLMVHAVLVYFLFF